MENTRTTITIEIEPLVKAPRKKGNQGPKSDAAQLVRYCKEVNAIEKPSGINSPADYICQRDLKSLRGWDKDLIDRVLGEPDSLRENRRAPSGTRGRRVRLYLGSRVLAAESGDIRVRARRKARRVHAEGRIDRLSRKLGIDLTDCREERTQ